jgi:hypothetical protein
MTIKPYRGFRTLNLQESQMSSISAVSSQQYTPPVQRAKVDADGDHDGSKQGEVEKPAPKPISATIGNNINTTA